MLYRCSTAGVGWWRHRRGEPPGRGGRSTAPVHAGAVVLVPPAGRDTQSVGGGGRGGAGRVPLRGVSVPAPPPAPAARGAVWDTGSRRFRWQELPAGNAGAPARSGTRELSELHWDLILGKARDYPGRSVSRSGQV